MLHHVQSVACYATEAFSLLQHFCKVQYPAYCLVKLARIVPLLLGTASAITVQVLILSLVSGCFSLRFPPEWTAAEVCNLKASEVWVCFRISELGVCDCKCYAILLALKIVETVSLACLSRIFQLSCLLARYWLDFFSHCCKLGVRYLFLSCGNKDCSSLWPGVNAEAEYES